MQHDDRAYFFDMLESARAILSYIEGVDSAAFERNREKQDAVIRRFAIIGEASKHVSKDAKKRWPALPYDLMYKMRNVVVHDYSGVNLLTIWETAHNDLPVLTASLDPVIQGFLREEQ